MKPAPQDHGLEGFKGTDPNGPFRVWLRKRMAAEYDRLVEEFWQAALHGAGTGRPKGIK